MCRQSSPYHQFAVLDSLLWCVEKKVAKSIYYLPVEGDGKVIKYLVWALAALAVALDVLVQ